MLWTRRISMKNHRFLWLRNRTTNNRKCEKARNIKEKRTIEMFNTAWRLLVARPSSASADRDFKMPQNPGNSTVSGAFLFWFCCFLLRKFDALYPIFNGLTIGENLPPFRALRGASIETIFPPGIFVLLWYYFQIALHHWRRYGRIRYRGGTDA